ncbi:ATP synthase subunit I [Methylocaldum szegediense]|uniref:ATP synthase protein I n=1 Tax=Methylocaldum szegediense TaxID=73780 RepID=A0ABN8X7U5_9GAMM|nr:ATP synthase subunit I [Methylocaldum szegediense]CAI8879500.1 ATP synthase protein I [Methylocaldum szegediense]
MGAKKLFFAVKRVLLMQLLAIAVVGAFTWAFFGLLAARSALLGGLTAFLPNLYFATKFGFSDRTRTAKEIVRSFYIGEVIKIIITAGLFILIFQLPNILFLPLFAGFISVLMVFWCALLMRESER